MKRFTDTDKWSDPWFASLPIEEQHIWLFLWDKCDIAGFWIINLRDLQHFTGANREHWNALLASAGANRLRVIGERVWLVTFIAFQFPRGLHPRDLQTKSVIRSFAQANAGQANGKELTRGLEGAYKSLIERLLEGASKLLARTYEGPQEQEREQERGLVSPEGEGECRGGVETNGVERPGWDEVRIYADRIGLGEWKAKDWFDEMEGCGWLDFNKRPIQRWQNVANRVKAKWEADGRPSGPPAAKSAPGTTKPQTVYEMKTIIEAKRVMVSDLERKHSYESATGREWKDAEARKQCRKLLGEIKELTAKIGGQ